MTLSSRQEKAAAPAFGDFQIVAVAGAMWWAAYEAPSVPWWIPAVLVPVGILTKSRWLVAAGLVMVAAVSGYAAETAYESQRGSGRFDESIRIIGDVETFDFGGRVLVQAADGRRLEMTAYGSDFASLQMMPVGAEADVEGTLNTVEAPWHRARHIVGSVSATEVTPTGERSLWRVPIEWVRHRILAGAHGLDRLDRPLYAGLTVGDDSDQSIGQTEQYTRAGLLHLTAVSGQNVAFVLALVSPIVNRLDRPLRLAAVIGVLCVFALATRLEPSVLRATVSAGLATSLTLMGLRSSGIRVLGIAVGALLLVDPFLAQSVGFQLSVAASLGILLAGPWLRLNVPGPSFIVDPIAVTVAAQVGVAPILLLTFGELPLAGLVANPVAGWAAGFVMVWGLTVGVVAGLSSVPLAEVIQTPPTVCLWWLNQVADVTSSAPLPVLSTPDSIIFAGSGATLAILRPLWGSFLGRLMALLAVSVFLGQMVLATPHPPKAFTETDTMVYLPSSSGPTALIVKGEGSDQVVAWLVANRVRQVDVVVLEQGGRVVNRIHQSISTVAAVAVTFAPAQHQVVGGTRVTEPTVVVVGGGTLELTPEQGRLRWRYSQENQP